MIPLSHFYFSPKIGSSSTVNSTRGGAEVSPALLLRWEVTTVTSKSTQSKIFGLLNIM